jgi:signal transduction histidine kinase
MCFQARLSLYGGVIALLLLTSLSVIYYRSEERILRDRASAELVLRLNRFNASLPARPKVWVDAMNALAVPPPTNIPELLEAAVEGTDIIAIAEVPDMAPSASPAGVISPEAAAELTASGRIIAPAEIQTGNGRWLVYSPSPGPGPRPFLITLARPMAGIAARLDFLRNLLIATETVAILFVLINGWWVANSALAPVRKMTRQAREIADSANFSGRIAVSGRSGELGELADTLNLMLARLGDAHSSQKQFLAHAAHELRTPLTVVTTSLDAARAAATAPDNKAQALDLAAAESARMSRLVADLMELARNDTGQPLLIGPVALDAIVMRVYQTARLVASDVSLELGHWDQAEILGDPDRIQQTVTNLVDNALRYTPAGGRITIDLTRRDSAAVVGVSDTGSGIDPRHIPHIFDRFYRAGDTPDHRSGAGLGLAIARDIVLALGGTLTVNSTPGMGSRFEVSFPLAGPETMR